MTPLELLAIALVAAGTFFGFVAVVGIVRLPDLYARAHATSKSDTLGIILTLGGVALVLGADVSVAKTVLLGAFLFVTNPTAAHAITRAAHDQGIEPWTTEDEASAAGDGAKPTEGEE
ncbi:monovalent cation/H(+) antiporter subunit G [Halobellus rufus]|uniref:monovalent cation/H(+) antiporter subunit G n=1 Tax=Halobellus rufus TaxID=1448860 RepID=UPI000678FBC7|nr:monovalent cation/H(+) antiporter subunit G [Halobellus rufus]